MVEFVFELLFNGLFELAIGFFFPHSADTGALFVERKPDGQRDDWYMVRIVGFLVLFSLLIGGLWFSYLHP